MAKLTSYEKVMKELTKMKKKYDKEESSKALKEAAKNERAANKLAKMKDFALYSDDKFDSVSELGLSESYSEGGINPEWN
jgi:N-methylhydantoinase B/oxoprolinase/acetone carboxylase alpha subunit